MKDARGPETEPERYFVSLLREDENPHLLEDKDLERINSKVLAKLKQGVNQAIRRQLRTFVVNEKIAELRTQHSKDLEEIEKSVKMPEETIMRLKEEIRNKDDVISEKEEDIKTYKGHYQQGKRDLEEYQKDWRITVKNTEETLNDLQSNLNGCTNDKHKLRQEYDRLKEYDERAYYALQGRCNSEQHEDKEALRKISYEYTAVKSLITAISLTSLGLISIVTLLSAFHGIFLHYFPIRNLDFRKTFFWMIAPTVWMTIVIYIARNARGTLETIAAFLLFNGVFWVIYVLITLALVYSGIFTPRWSYFTELAILWNLLVVLASVLPLIITN